MAQSFSVFSVRKEEGPTRRERIAALRYLVPLIRMVWQTHRGYTLAMLLLRLLRAFVPVATLWVGKLIVDTVVAAISSAPDTARLWKLVAIEIGIVVTGDVLARISALVESLLGDLFSNHTSIRLMEHAATLDLYHFEDPSFYDKLERARRQTSGRVGLLAQLFEMGQSFITLISLGAAMFFYTPWLLLLLVIATLPSFLGENHFAVLEYSLINRWTPERRLLDYLRYAGASDRTAKEVQLFGLSRWLTDRFRALSQKFYDENKKLSSRKAVVSLGLSLIGTLGYYAAYAVILLRAVNGVISLGTLTFLSGAFQQSRGGIRGILMQASGIYYQCLYLKDLFEFFEMKPSIASSPDARMVPQPIKEGFVFEDVGFRYPESDRWAVRHVSFRLRPGERIAFVGENGAGKTTLTKLLARLYDPTEGRILLDGCDLREYDLQSLRRAIGVIFQDFVRFDFRFDENIGVGEIDRVRNYLDQSESENGAAPGSIVSAAEKSLAASLLPRFAEGYRQMLGRRFDKGVDLSGGEWQKVALARAYMRDAQALILDEPTASLDARAEYEVFIRFSRLVEGKMAIIISHRFSTVRMADRIIVLKDGSIVEEGTHDELVRSNGLYAELFAMQAEGYR
ncbi:MAG TPA: ABC transporter ATP-binding protein [Blastocatellia bacterium]|jgi:ATP-binding cassette subfamily B protein